MELLPVVQKQTFASMVRFGLCPTDYGFSDDLCSGFGFLDDSVFGLVPSSIFGLLFPGQKELSVNLALRLGLRLPRLHELPGKRFDKLINLMLMMQLRVPSLKNGHFNARGDHTRHIRKYSTLCSEDATVA